MAGYSDEELRNVAETYSYYKSQENAASALGISRGALRRRLKEYRARSENGGDVVKGREFSIN